MKNSVFLFIALISCSGVARPTEAKAVKAPGCSPPSVFTTALDHLEGYRVFTGPDGDSAVEPLWIDIRQVPLLKTGKKLGILDLPKSGERQPQIVVGAADVELPLHPAPYKEMFVLLGGSFTFKTAKHSYPMVPGSVLLFEDVNAKIGHGGHIGQCGYVSLSIAPRE